MRLFCGNRLNHASRHQFNFCFIFDCFPSCFTDLTAGQVPPVAPRTDMETTHGI